MTQALPQETVPVYISSSFPGLMVSQTVNFSSRVTMTISEEEGQWMLALTLRRYGDALRIEGVPVELLLGVARYSGALSDEADSGRSWMPMPLSGRVVHPDGNRHQTTLRTRSVRFSLDPGDWVEFPSPYAHLAIETTNRRDPRRNEMTLLVHCPAQRGGGHVKVTAMTSHVLLSLMHLNCFTPIREDRGRRRLLVSPNPMRSWPQLTLI